MYRSRIKNITKHQEKNLREAIGDELYEWLKTINERRGKMNQVTVVKEFTFDAAHRLPGYEGKCKNLHGHGYRLLVGVKGKIDYDSGMVIDFTHLKIIVKQEILDHVDHVLLNDLKSEPGQLGFNFPWEMPTAENMVIWILSRLQNRWEEVRIEGKISFVRLYETPTSYAEVTA